MSTILDALRKVEEDQQAKNADARTRLLSFPPRPLARPPRRQHPLLSVSTGLLLAGFVAGAGLMYWGPDFSSKEEQRGGKEVVSLSPDMQPAPPSASVGMFSAPPVADVEDPPLAELKSRFAVDPPAPPSPLARSSVPAVSMSKKPLPAPLAPADPPGQTLALGKEKKSFSRDRQAEPPSPVTPTVQAARDLLTQATQDLAARKAPVSVPSPVTSEALPVDLTPEPSIALPVPPPVRSNPPPANTSLSFLQWSPEPDKRMAFIRVNGGPLTLAHEGDTVAGYTVVEIRPNAVDLRSGEANFTLQVER